LPFPRVWKRWARKMVKEYVKSYENWTINKKIAPKNQANSVVLIIEFANIRNGKPALENRVHYKGNIISRITCGLLLGS
jgi:hypothetical protein